MDELRQKLLYTTIELQRLKVQSMEETRKNKEYMDQLVQLVQSVIRERDEARSQVQKILSGTHGFVTNPVSFARTNSGLTDSTNNSLSENNTQNHYCSSPVESLLDPVPSPGGPGEQNGRRAAAVLDRGGMVIDGLARGRPLPEKGKFLTAVLEAGPLLQTHLLAGPLPRWRNPPQLKPFHIPQVSLARACSGDHDGGDGLVTAAAAVARSRMAEAQPYFEMSCGSSSQMMSNYGMLSFGSAPPSVISAGSDFDCYGHISKRQRLN
ncbi:unnamed protein product [Cuscuta campestris]|uniref:Uncharacterized protein n=1 Tax=Cuscuta campestris TaxID=132261 RepID=A0A484LJX7_9ASTE|nr:unnamed protein product [Cuscuta campestris]